MKTGVIDVGGGLRGIYAAGILDTCLEEKVSFDYCIGISAGSANLSSYLAGQKGRNYQFYCDYSFRSQYMGIKNWAQTGSYINLEYICDTLSNSDGEYPLNYQYLSHNHSEFIVIALNAITGEKKLFHKEDMAQDNYHILMASCCVPGVNQPVKIGNDYYFDGGLADPVPIKQAFQDGCDRVVLILNKPVSVIRKSFNSMPLVKILQGKYPLAAENLKLKANRYNEGVRLAKKYAKQGKVLILSPDDTMGVIALRSDKTALKRLYEKGVRDGKVISKWLDK